MKRTDWLKLSSPVVFALIVAGVLGLGGVVVYLPQWQTASLRQGVEDYRSSLPKPDPKELATLEKGRIDSENAIRTAFIQGIGGTVLLIGLYFTFQNLKATQRNVAIAEDKQVTERFSKAVDMLSSSSLHTRLGGIYALERIAKDSDKDYGQVMEVLTAFVREESSWPPEQPHAVETSTLMTEESEPPSLRTDIQAVMTVIGRRQPRHKEDEAQRLNLRQTDLRQLHAQGANLTDVDLRGSHLEYANLSDTHLEYTNLSDTHLEYAALWGAHLEYANLRGTHLEQAALWGANLSQVFGLTQAQLDLAQTSKTTILPDDLLAAQPQAQVPIATPSPATPEPNSEPQTPAT